MSSQDLLGQLMEAEGRAEELVHEAKAEADRRIASARGRAELARAKAYEAAVKAAATEREAAEAAIEAEYAEGIESYRARLESSALDEAAFAKACEQGLSGMA
jgi:vacuolar-type H+-ATPase subunit H